jgi:hypothetical protein
VCTRPLEEEDQGSAHTNFKRPSRIVVVLA